ncbi:MAG TPA: hypothetical protein DGH68_01310 [Bacteroidetes bacterium]|nr:hypothetical protein [Bacteroidota bacterium]
MARTVKNMSRRMLWVMLLPIVAVWSPLAAEETAQEVLEKTKNMYDSISDAQIKFSQKTKFELSKIEQNVSGTLYLKKANKYRLETEGQTVVTDGETVWSYTVTNKQVLVDHFKVDENTITPERILTAAPNDYISTLLGKDKIGKTEVVALKLTPKGEQSLVKSMKLWIDNSTWLIRKALITDVNGKQTEYLVTEAKTNMGIQDSRFVFQVPEGVEVVDLR